MSTGLKAALYGNFGIKAMLQLGNIDIYSGDQPLSADAPIQGDWLARIYDYANQNNGLQVTVNQFGQLAKDGTWTVQGISTGTAGWWRWTQYQGDGGSVSVTAPRIDGLVGESLILSDVTITPGSMQDINIFSMQFLED